MAELLMLYPKCTDTWCAKWAERSLAIGSRGLRLRLQSGALPRCRSMPVLLLRGRARRRGRVGRVRTRSMSGGRRTARRAQRLGCALGRDPHFIGRAARIVGRVGGRVAKPPRGVEIVAHPTAVGALFSGREVFCIQGWNLDPNAPLSMSLTSTLRAAVTV